MNPTIGCYVYSIKPDGSDKRLIQIILDNGDKYDLRRGDASE